MSATIQHLQSLYGNASLDGDLVAARRWRQAIEHLKQYEARHERANHCVACPWSHSDTCRTCPLSGEVKA